MMHKATQEAILRNRRLQAERNRLAMDEEARRQAALPGTPKMDMAAVPEDKMLPDPVEATKTIPTPEAPEPEPEESAFEDGPTGLEDVPFASARALQVAEDAELTADDFSGVKPSGKGDTFTTADVRAIQAEQSDE